MRAHALAGGGRHARACASQKTLRALPPTPRRSSVAARSSSPVGKTTREIPIFPLGVVALPHATVPLMIFEPRYRVLFNTLMDGAPDIEEGLVQKDSPYAGTRKFGMCYVDGTSGRMAT